MTTPAIRAMKRAAEKAADAQQSSSNHALAVSCDMAVATGLLPQEICEEHLLQIEAVTRKQDRGDITPREADQYLRRIFRSVSICPLCFPVEILQ